MSQPATESGTDIEIRQATPGDADALVELSAQLGYAVTREALLARLPQLAADDELLVATAGGQVVAWIHLSIHRTIIEEPTAFIFGLVVADGWRSQGIGARMLEAADDYAMRHGIGKVQLRSNVIRDRAHEFYRRMGFTVVKQQLAFSRRRDAQGGE